MKRVLIFCLILAVYLLGCYIAAGPKDKKPKKGDYYGLLTCGPDCVNFDSSEK